MDAKRDKALAALLSSPSVALAAEKVGVGERTLYRWLAEDEEFKSAYAQARREAIAQAAAVLQNSATLAAVVLQMVAADRTANPAVRVTAAATILRYAFQVGENDTAERLAELERQFAELAAKNGHARLGVV
jgi:hypothetical protein